MIEIVIKRYLFNLFNLGAISFRKKKNKLSHLSILNRVLKQHLLQKS